MSVSDLEKKKRELCDSFDAVAETMRTCAQLASNFSKYVAGLPVDVPAVGNSKSVSNEDEENGKGKRKRAPRAKRDPDAPKRPSSAYLHFQNDVRAWYKQQNPGLAYSALVEEIAKKWKELQPDQKKKYHDMVDDDKKRFDTEMRAYRIKKGLDPNESKAVKAKDKKVAPKLNSAARKVAEASSPTDDSESSPQDKETPAIGSAVSPSDDEVSESEDESEDESGEEEENITPSAKRPKITNKNA